MIDQQGLVEETGAVSAETGGRPAKLYRFRREILLERAVAGSKHASPRATVNIEAFATVVIFIVVSFFARIFEFGLMSFLMLRSFIPNDNSFNATRVLCR